MSELENNKVRVIRISRDALFEFIYEKFIENQDIYLDIVSTEVSDHFAIDFETGSFIFCAVKTGDGEASALPGNIDLKKAMKNIPDTADTMFAPDRYRDYTIDELSALSHD